MGDSSSGASIPGNLPGAGELGVVELDVHLDRTGRGRRLAGPRIDQLSEERGESSADELGGRPPQRIDARDAALARSDVPAEELRRRPGQKEPAEDWPKRRWMVEETRVGEDRLGSGVRLLRRDPSLFRPGRA